MPDFPIIDTHLHLWDIDKFSYPWLDDVSLLKRNFQLDDYNQACKPVDVEAMVFVQCEVEPDKYFEEAAWVVENAESDPRIKGLVAWAPLENGDAVRKDLDRLNRFDLLRGIRRIIQFESSLDFCLQTEFINGVRLLSEYGLHFEICIDHRHFENVIKFVKQCDEVPMILNHIGKPNIKNGELDDWKSQICQLAELDNVVCKMSGVATEANHDCWNPDELKPFIQVAAEAFGFDRLIFGSDWPVATLAIDYSKWISTLEWALDNPSTTEKTKLFRDNAIDFYRLDRNGL